MVPLDTATLMVVSTLLSIALGLMWLVLSAGRDATPGQRAWGASLIAFAGGTAALGLRGAVPDWISIDLGNLLVATGLGFCWHGARAFDGRATHPLLPFLPALLWILARQSPALTGTLESRILLTSVLTSPLLLAITAEFLRGWRESPLFRLMLAGAFGLHALLILSRIPVVLLQAAPWSAGTTLPGNPWFSAILLESILHGVGTSFGLLALFRQRSERRALRAIAASRDAAEQANAAKSRFLARMSHELRTPLNGVLGLSQVLSEDHALPQAAREQAAVIQHAGHHLLALVNDVLDLAQVEAGRLTLRPAPMALRPLLASTAALVQPQALRKRQSLQAEMAPGCPPAVRGDARRIQQVLLNLLGNAVKFSPQGGRVRLTVHPLPGGGLRFEVQDDGPGIPPAQRALLFRDFSRLPEAGPQPVEGAGLGLAISAGLVQAMGGMIGVLAGPNGRGCRFWVELPLPGATLPSPGNNPPPQPAVLPTALAAALPNSLSASLAASLAAAHSPPAAPAGAPRRVLVVDDVAVNRLVVQALLQSAGHQVAMAEDGETALALLAGSAFDLVLLDLQMEGMSGLETARRIREAEARQPGQAPLTILALTGEAEPEAQQACLAAGMNGHLAKPVDRATLLAAMHRIGPPQAAARPSP